MRAQQFFYIPSLDGFRAVAVIIVFLSHAGLGDVVPGGFGVTIFFFLSGYLITTLLRQEYEKNNTINFKNFYLRRIYRIFPPMYLILFSLLILALLGKLQHDMNLTAVLSQIFHLTNYYIVFNGATHIIPDTGMYWSLAIEEHFYLVFPFFFLTVVQRWRYPVVAKMLFSLCVIVLLWRVTLIYGWNAPSSRIYSATDTRLDSLLFGCMMGVWANPALDQEHNLFGPVVIKIGALVLSVGVLLFTLIYRDENFRQTFRYTLQGMALFPLFWLAVKHPGWPIFRCLNWPPVRWLGNISYTFYLSSVFWLDIVHGRGGLLAAGIIAFILTLVFSLLVYWLVERPFAALRRERHGNAALTHSVPPGLIRPSTDGAVRDVL